MHVKPARPISCVADRVCGREKEAAAAKELLPASRMCALVTGHGPAESGKTRLAVEWGRCLIEMFPGGSILSRSLAKRSA